MTKHDDKIWAACVNLSGLWGPMQLHRKEHNHYWFSSCGNFMVEKTGIHDGLGFTTFASVDKKEVETWVSGVKTTMKMLRNWARC